LFEALIQIKVNTELFPTNFDADVADSHLQ